MNLNDYIFERHLDEWLNIQDEINEKSYNYGYRPKPTGFWGWLKELGRKFWNWLTGKDYDDDKEWWWDTKSKGIHMTPEEYAKFLKSNKALQKRFPTSFEISQDDDYENAWGRPIMNGDKEFPACMSFTDDIEETIDILQNSVNNNKWQQEVETWVHKTFKKEKVVFVINIEFSEDNGYIGYAEMICKEIYASIIDNSDDYEYKKVCIFIDSPMMAYLFKPFLNNNLAELQCDKNRKVILITVDSLKQFKNAKPPKENPNKTKKDDDKNKDKNKSKDKDTNKKDDKKEEEKVEKQREEEEKTLSEFETLDIINQEKKHIAEVRYYNPQQVKDIFANKEGDKYRTLMKDYHGFEISPKKDDEEYIVFDIIKKNDIEEVGTSIISYILKNIAEHFANKQSTKDTRIYFLVSKDKPEFDSIKKRVAEEDLKLKKYEFGDTNVVIKRRPLDAAKNGASETNQVRFYFIAAKPKEEKTNESRMSLSKYFLYHQINEALDENIFYLLDTWFFNRDNEKSNFMTLVSDCINKKTYNKNDIEELCGQYGIEIAPMVNFINQEININPNNNEIDYPYNMKLIIDAIVGNKSKSNTYVKNTYEIKEQ